MLSNAVGQETIYKYWIQLRDKAGSPYTLDDPGAFLSQRAIDRRLRYNIPMVENDLPLSPVYLDSLLHPDIDILYSSKWMNAVVVETSDSNMADTLSAYSFVTGIELLYRTPDLKSAALKFKESLSDEPLPSDHQVEMLNGHLIHEQGYQGNDMVIAVIDAGFDNTDNLAGFDMLFQNGQVLGTRNFVDRAANFFWNENGSHGTNVLSIMGGYLPGEYEGAAIQASYWLIQTEDIRSEFRIEEANWLVGAELADSAGVDVINSSLGYSDRFTDISQNYTYADLDGKTTLVTRAAMLAASKGILVVTSAGNAGSTGDPWQYIIAPADGDSVMGVAAVDANGQRASFSSRGPSADGRIKPDVAAQGLTTSLIRSSGQVGTGNGTSFSSPVMAGLATCLWQKHRELNNYEIIEKIRRTASQYYFPDTLLGYGIPDLALADIFITALKPTENLVHIFPNPSLGFINLWLPDTDQDGDRYEIFDVAGRKMQIGTIYTQQNQVQISVELLHAGTYIIIIYSGDKRLKGIFTRQ